MLNALNMFKRESVVPCQFLRLISDKTSPNFFWHDDSRIENRSNRTLPVTISPWGKRAPVVAQMKVALTKDISDGGVCLICPFNVVEKQIVIGILVKATEIEEPLFFLADVCNVKPFAEGFWNVGVKATELLNTNYRKQIKEMIPLAANLLSPPGSEE